MTDKHKNEQSPDKPAEPAKSAKKAKAGPGVLKVMQSILAGALGVQSDKRREEDFSSHSPWPYIFAGFLFTVGFVVTSWWSSSWCLPASSDYCPDTQTTAKATTSITSKTAATASA